MADVSIGRPRVGQRAAFVSAPPHAWRWLLAGAGMVLLLLVPALWNGFPLIFPDTGGYLTRPIEGTLGMGRSALYGWFLYVSLPLAFWPVIVAQAAAMAWLIALTLRCHGLGGRPWLALAVTAALAVATSLPWFAAQLMPDILFPMAGLALHLLAFRTDRLSVAERVGLGALVAVTIASHMAALGLCLALIAALVVLTRITFFALPPARILWPTGAAGAGLALCLVSNLAVTGNFAFTPGGSSFLFGRLIEDGIVGRYVNEHCPDPKLRICDYKLPGNADDWLWANDTPFYKLGGWDGYGAEANRIILASLKLYPRMHIEAAIRETLAQLTSFETEISIDDNEPTFDSIRDHAPALLPAYTQARQQEQRFDVGPLNALHVPVAALSMAALVLALVLRRPLRLAPEAAALCLAVLLALAINAAICGVFSHAVDRYQSRLVALTPFALVVVFMRRKDTLMKSL